MPREKFFGCLKSTIYDVAKRCADLEESKESSPAKKNMRKNNKDSRIHLKSSF